ARFHHGHVINKSTQFQHTFKIQLGEGRVFLQRPSQSLCSLRSELVPWLNKNQLDLTIDMQTINPPNSDIPLRFSWVRVVFCFRGSARSCSSSDSGQFPG